MKIAVYTIALNEEQFAKRWAESATEADLLLIADTGSTDQTVEIARELGVEVVRIDIKPWRFDKARNAALKFLPDDIDFCIALDMDEVLVPGWRDHLEAVADHVTRPRYEYTWSWNADGSAGLVYGGDKIHRRKGYSWKHPVHEVLVCSGVEVQDWIGLKIHHFPDHNKSRNSYLPLLKLAVEEDPDDDRNAFYYARELYFYRRNKEATEQFLRHLSLPKAVWKPERAASYRYLAKADWINRFSWLLHAVAEAPDRREAWVDLSLYYYEQGDSLGCLWAAENALRVTEKPLEYLCEDFAWGALPFDLAAWAAWQIKQIDKAETYAEQAVALDPDNLRLNENLVLIRTSRQQVLAAK